MAKIAIVTDSNSGITKKEANENGITVISMPFTINGVEYLEDISLTQEQFYEKLADGADVSTSMPSLGFIEEKFSELLKEYDEIVYIPMSSGLSSSCHSAKMFVEDSDFSKKVEVVDNKRISVTQRQAALDAIRLCNEGKSARQIREILEEDAENSSIYIMLDTLYYLKKGGRITTAAAAIGTILRIKPVLQIQGDKLDAFAKARTSAHGKRIMMNAIRDDAFKRFGPLTPDNVIIAAAYTYDKEAAAEWKKELEAEFPGFVVHMSPLSLSVSCHIGPGAIAVTITKKLKTGSDSQQAVGGYTVELGEKEKAREKARIEKEAQKKRKWEEKQQRIREKEAWKDAKSRK